MKPDRPRTTREVEQRMQQCDEARSEVLFDLFFTDCAGDADIYTTALRGMCEAYRDVRAIADKINDGEIPPEQSVNTLARFSFMRDTFFDVRSRVTQEAYEDILDIPEGILHQFEREPEGRARAVRVVNGFSSGQTVLQYERCTALLIFTNNL